MLRFESEALCFKCFDVVRMTLQVSQLRAVKERGVYLAPLRVYMGMKTLQVN